jgi:hypothetical protein
MTDTRCVVKPQAWRKQRQIDRERRDVEFAAMRAEKDAERKQLAKELAGEPFDKEVRFPTANVAAVKLCEHITFKYNAKLLCVCVLDHPIVVRGRSGLKHQSLRHR